MIFYGTYVVMSCNVQFTPFIIWFGHGLVLLMYPAPKFGPVVHKRPTMIVGMVTTYADRREENASMACWNLLNIPGRIR